MKKLIWITLAIMLICSTVLTGCGDPEETTTPTTSAATKPTTSATTSVTSSVTTPPSTEDYGGTLKMGYPYSLVKTPGWPSDTTSRQRVLAAWTVFEPLIRLGEDGTPDPYLATSWEWGPDNEYITFNLREGVMFHDGTPFTAEAVKLEGDILIENNISNAVNWDRWEIIDDHTVRLYINKYQIDVFASLTDINMMFFSPTAYKENGEEWMAEHPIGTGPFKFESFEKDVALKLVKNENYWKADRPYMDGIDIIFITERLTQVSALQAGTVDMLVSIPGKTLYDMEQLGFNVIAKAGGTAWLMFDTVNEDSIFSDPLVRKAIEYAINKEAIVNALGFGYMWATNQMTPPHLSSFNSDLPWRNYDPEKAKELLAEAGYSSGFSAKMITMGAGGAGDRAIAIQEFLRAVDIDVELEVVDNPKYWDYMSTGWSNAIVDTDYAVPLFFPVWLRGTFPPTSTSQVSVKLPDELLNKLDAALSEPDPEKAKQLSDELIQIIFDDATYVPIYSSARGFILAPEIRGTNFYEYYSYFFWDPADTWIKQ